MSNVLTELFKMKLTKQEGSIAFVAGNLVALNDPAIRSSRITWSHKDRSIMIYSFGISTV